MQKSGGRQHAPAVLVTSVIGVHVGIYVRGRSAAGDPIAPLVIVSVRIAISPAVIAVSIAVTGIVVTAVVAAIAAVISAAAIIAAPDA
jgi:hypothetical protein